MKYTVTNKSSAPHDLMTLKGRVVALPGKPVDVYFDAGIAGVYAAVPFFDVSPLGESPKMVKIDLSKSEAVKLTDGGTVIPEQSAVNAAPNHRDPLDHDGDGRKGGSLPKRGPGRPPKNP